MPLELDLIKLYDYVCTSYNEELCHEVQRFSNNSKAVTFTISDEELITIYLFCKTKGKIHKLNAMHEFISNYWKSWFPKLPSYPVFVTRLNFLKPAFEVFIQYLCSKIDLPQDSAFHESLLGDSMPIITCSHKRKAKVAREISNKGYCASKDLNYFGVKLHVFASENSGHLPKPKFIGITPASEHDLTASKGMLEKLLKKEVFLDKAYSDAELKLIMSANNTTIFVPNKTAPRASDEIKKRDKAFNDLSTTAVAQRRQPIESFFSWIQSQTQIHIASKVRSTAGLFVHIYGSIAAAILNLFIFNT